MAKQPINNGKVVERSYEDYRNNQYLVNRRYQRKLVWELEEKQAFIDSLANVPLQMAILFHFFFLQNASIKGRIEAKSLMACNA